MGRRITWLLSPLAVAVGWSAAHALTYGMPGHHLAHDVTAGPAPLCGATAMTLLLVVLLLIRPVLALGYELRQRFATGWAPRPPVWAAPALPGRTEPERARPSVLATGHGERAPPFAVSSA
jgi:hypothetical protein